MVDFYGLKTCDTCRKARKALEAAGNDVAYTDVRDNGVSAKDLKRFAKAVGWEALLNTRSTTWRGLNDAAKADMSESKAIALMGEHPTLMKRPIIDYAGDVTVGWNGNIQQKWALTT